MILLSFATFVIVNSYLRHNKVLLGVFLLDVPSVAADVLSISDAMRRLIVDRPLYEKFKRNTIDVSGDLSWDEPVRLMEKLYKESLQR